MIPSKMLTFKEDTEFFKLLSTKLKQNIARCQFKLLYRASEHKYSASTFHKFCDGHSRTITIIKSNFGNIFGGFTSTKWRSNWYSHRDKEAFLFLIRSNDAKQECPVLFDYRDEDVAVFHSGSGGPVFGHSPSDIFIAEQCNEGLCYTSRVAYDHHNELCGGDQHKSSGKYYFDAIEYSVFEII